MDLFSISQLQQFSGIKAHTIRIWEQRYNALRPHRTDGNTRYYDNSQLRRLLNIVSLMNLNFKVSELCLMPDEKMFRVLENQLKETSSNDSAEYFISQMIAAGMNYDEPHFEKIFSNCHLRFGMKDTYVNVMYPMLVRIGMLWTKDGIPSSQEHFISNLLRQKIFSAIDALPPVKSQRNSWILFLPENEFHEIGLLFTSYLLRLHGKKVIYLGANIPLDALSEAAVEIKPAHLFFFLVHYDIPENVQEYLNTLVKKNKNSTLHFSGNEKLISQLKLKKEMNWIRSVDDLQKIIS